jgi:hypothetical protein
MQRRSLLTRGHIMARRKPQTPAEKFADFWGLTPEQVEERAHLIVAEIKTLIGKESPIVEERIWCLLMDVPRIKSRLDWRKSQLDHRKKMHDDWLRASQPKRGRDAKTREVVAEMLALRNSDRGKSSVSNLAKHFHLSERYVKRLLSKAQAETNAVSYFGPGMLNPGVVRTLNNGGGRTD